MDEQFVHQIPEPLPNVVAFHQHWRESLFFILHPPSGPGDVVILTLAHYPARQMMDSLQLPEAMLAVWHWEYPTGARLYTDGCLAPAGRETPVPVIDFRHDLRWTDKRGRPVDYGRDGDDVVGLSGHVDLVLEGGRTIGIDAEGRWAQRYGP